MTAKETQVLIRQNLAMYRVGEKTFTEEQAATQLAIWAAALREIPAEVALQAMQRAFAVCRFPVTLADLFDQLRAMQASQLQTTAEVWREVLQAAHKAYNNMAEYRYTMKTPSGKTQGQLAKERNREIFAALHPAAKEWLGSAEELAALDELDARTLSYRQKDFARLHYDFACRRELNPELLQRSITGTKRAELTDLKTSKNL